MSAESSVHGNPRDTVPAAIAMVTEAPNHFPPPVDAANCRTNSRNACPRGSGRLNKKACSSIAIMATR